MSIENNNLLHLLFECWLVSGWLTTCCKNLGNRVVFFNALSYMNHELLVGRGYGSQTKMIYEIIIPIELGSSSSPLFTTYADLWSKSTTATFYEILVGS